MKIYVYLKDPDGFSNAIQEEVEAEVAAIAKAGGLDGEETRALIESRVEKANKALERWVEYGEYVGIDFDTEAGTATVRARS